MGRIVEKAFKGALWMGVAAAVIGAGAVAIMSIGSALPFATLAWAAGAAALQAGVAGLIGGAVWGGFFGAVTDNTRVANIDYGKIAAASQSATPALVQQQALAQQESYSRGFQDAVLQSRVPSPNPQATR